MAVKPLSESSYGGELWDAGSSDEVREGSRLVVDAAGRTVGIYRLQNELYAYDNVCPHQGGPACQGLIVPRVLELLDESQASVGNAFDESDLHVVCPWHGFEFSIRTGRHAAVTTIRLKPVHVEERAGRVYVGF